MSTNLKTQDENICSIDVAKRNQGFTQIEENPIFPNLLSEGKRVRVHLTARVFATINIK